MTDQHDIQVELNDLRQAIEAHEWYACELAYRKLFLRLSMRNILALLFAQMEGVLPYFESRFPQTTWFREWLTEAQQFMPISSSIAVVQYPDHAEEIEYLSHELPSQIFNGLQSSVEFIMELYDYYIKDKTPTFWIDLAVSALRGLLNIQTDAYVEQHFPDIWQARYASDLDETTVLNLSQTELRDFMRIYDSYQTCLKARFETLQFELADKIDSVLPAS